jgi:tripartite-type tricarboxylate transporter receptor subunit TctC
MRTMFLSAVAAVGLLTAPAAFAEYPEKDIRAIVPWGAGGGADAIVRKIMSIAEKELPTDVFVENIEGGVTSIGINRVMSAPADGYTVGALTYDSVITVPWQELLPGYDLEKLRMVALVTREPNALMVGADTGFETFDQIIAAAKERPGEISVGIHGLGSMTHLSLLALEEETGADFRLVSYPGGSAGQREAILSGEVEAVITSLGDLAPLLKAGSARGVVEFSAAPNPGFPDVPLSKDVGLEHESGSFLLFAVPAGTPDDAVATLESAIETAWKSDEFQQWAADVGVTASWLGKDDVTDWAMATRDEIVAVLDDLASRGIIEK